MTLNVAQARDGNDRTLVEVTVLQQRISYTAGGLPEYIGLAIPGLADDASGWQIKKLTYSGSNMTELNFADGEATFNKVWDDRATYTY